MRKIILLVFATILFSTSGYARRLKIISYPKKIAAGQLAIITFENPEPDHPIARSKCTADKLIAWVKSDVPILRFEQKGKQVYTSLGSYMSDGDNVIATFMVPEKFEPGDATLFLLNDRDPSVPYPLTIMPTMECTLTKTAAGYISPLGKVTVIGEGFLPSEILDPSQAIKELRDNIGYDKLSLGEQFTVLHRRIANDWARIAMGDFLELEQGGKKWELFVESCGMTKDGLTLDFLTPPDIKPGPATLSMMLRKDHNTVAMSAPLTVTVQ